MRTSPPRYNSMAAEVKAASAGEPKPSIEHPLRSIISIDMTIGMFPWITPIFDRFLFLLFQKGSATFRHHKVLPMAFVLSGGPGDTKDSAISICAPSNAARVSAEYWLRRGYLWTREEGPHFTLSPDENDRQFSQHCYTNTSGKKRSIYFDTTNSFGRENGDFLEYLDKR